MFGKEFCVFWCVSVLLVTGGCAPDKSQTADSSLSASEQTDNAECLTCHMDFQTELISARHESVGIGCTRCHGSSLAHGDDELNITPPDRLFGRAEVRPFCKGCHRTHKKGKVYDAFVEQWHSRRRPNGRMILDDSVCTDCHGKHAVLRIDQQQVMLD